jgi:hypothetical protein
MPYSANTSAGLTRTALRRIRQAVAIAPPLCFSSA